MWFNKRTLFTITITRDRLPTTADAVSPGVFAHKSLRHYIRTVALQFTQQIHVPHAGIKWQWFIKGCIMPAGIKCCQMSWAVLHLKDAEISVDRPPWSTDYQLCLTLICHIHKYSKRIKSPNLIPNTCP